MVPDEVYTPLDSPEREAITAPDFQIPHKDLSIVVDPQTSESQ